MRTATNEKAAPSPKSATRTTNELKPTTRAAQGARHGDKDRKWRPVRLGELIGPALDSLLQAGVPS